jgi:hypothetical protein
MAAENPIQPINKSFMEGIRSTLANEILDKTASGAQSGSFSVFHYSHRKAAVGVDRIGAEMESALLTVGRSELLQGSYVTASGKGLVERAAGQASDIRAVQQARAGAPNIMGVADLWVQGGFKLGLTNLGPEEKAATLIPIRGIFSQMFPTANLGKRGRQSDIVKNITAQIGKAAVGSEMEFLTKQLLASGVTIGSTEAEKLAFMFGATLERAKEIPDKMAWIKRVLNAHGLQTSARANSLFDVADVYGIGKLQAAIKNGGKGGYHVFSQFGGQGLDPFIEGVTKHHGEPYSKTLRSTLIRINEIMGKGQLAVALGEEGGVFLGQTGVWSSFRPLPAPFAAGGAIAESGVGAGMVQTGYKLASMQDISIRETSGARRLMHPAEAFLQALGQEVEAIGPSRRALAGTIHAAIKRAGIRPMSADHAGYIDTIAPGAGTLARWEEKWGFKPTLDDLADIKRKKTMMSRGRFSLYRSFYERSSINVGPGAFSNFKELMSATHGDIGRSVVPGGVLKTTEELAVDLAGRSPDELRISRYKGNLEGKVIEAITKDLEASSILLEELPMYSRGGAAAVAEEAIRDPRAFMKLVNSMGSMKGSNFRQGIVPTAMIQHLFLPGELAGVRGMSKGWYQAGGIQEIIDPTRIVAIKRSREAQGLGRRARALGTFAGTMEFEKEALIFGAGAQGKVHGYAGAREVVTEIPTTTAIVSALDEGPLTPKAITRSFGGDSAALLNSGRYGHVGTGGLRELPAVELYLGSAEVKEFITSVLGEEGKPLSKGIAEHELMRRLSGDIETRAGEPFLLGPAHKRLPLRKGARRGTVTIEGEAVTKALPATATHITGIRPSMRVGEPAMVYFGTTAAPSEYEMLINLQRVTARAGHGIAKEVFEEVGSEAARALGAVDIVAPQSSVATNPLRSMFHHRMGLFGVLMEGKFPQRDITQPARIPFMERFQRLMGDDLFKLEYDPGEGPQVITRKPHPRAGKDLKSLTRAELQAEAKFYPEITKRGGKGVTKEVLRKRIREARSGAEKITATAYREPRFVWQGSTVKDMEAFAERSRAALFALGVPEEAIDKEFEPVARLLAKAGHKEYQEMLEPIKHVPGTPYVAPNTEFAKALKQIKAAGINLQLELSTIAERQAGTADIGPGLMKVRMSKLMTMFDTLPAYIGSSGAVPSGIKSVAQDPAYIVMASTLIESLRGPEAAAKIGIKGGVNLSKMLDFRNIVGDEFVNMLRPFAKEMDRDTITKASTIGGKFGRREEIKVETLESAYKKIIGAEGGIRAAAVEGGIPGKDVLASPLFDPNRPGFYADLGFEVEHGSNVENQLRKAAAQAGKQLEEGAEIITGKSSMVYIPSGKYMRREAGFSEGLGRLSAAHDYPLSEDPLAKNITLLLEKGATKAETAKELEAIRVPAISLMEEYTKRMGKRGAFMEQGMAAEIPLSGRSRLVQTFSKGALTEAAPKLVGGKSGVFDVGVGEEWLKEQGKEGREILKELKRVDEKTKGKGFVYGYVEADPYHASHQSAVVRMKLDKELKGASSNTGLALHPYLASIMSRDNDKDTISFFLFGGKNKEALNRMARDEGGMGMLAKRVAAQEEANAGMYRMWLDQGTEAYERLNEGALFDDLKKIQNMTLEQAAEKFVPLVGYGAYPSMPFVQLDANKGVLRFLDYAGEKGADALADHFKGAELQKVFKNDLPTSVEIQKYLDFLRPTGGKGVQNQATAIRQAMSEFHALSQAVYQAPIQKAGKLQAYFDSFLSIGHQIGQLVRGAENPAGIGNVSRDTMEAAYARVNPIVSDWIGQMAGVAEEGIAEFGEDFKPIIGRMSEMIDAQDEQAIREAAEALTRPFVAAELWRQEFQDPFFIHPEAEAEYTRRYGVGMGGHGGIRSMKDSLTTFARSALGDVQKGVNFLFGEGFIGAGGEFEPVAAAAAENTMAGADRAIPPHSRNTLDLGVEWLFKNWRLVGAGVGILAGVRALGAVFGDDELPPPNITSARSLQQLQAPLPRSMSLDMPSPEQQFAPSVPGQRALLQPANSQYSMNTARGTSSSVNINELTNGYVANMGAISNANMNVHINDHRSFRSDYEMQTRINQMEDSDFIHQYMGDLA